ncbi:type VI secretion system contractile sheath large subunit [Alphaproteobacteria bacterium endosymbiont of Tiliacea citrago]|uniref:type VI secretion system contractile sheath large subunit n=1 Tax=Alphaproteobacteria bacterium endosymbiont of Tiliacea citrago TaxID=3077944 RepID=UPI003CC7AFE0
MTNKEERKALSLDIETKKMEATTKWLNEIKLIKPEVDSSFILNLFVELNEAFKTIDENNAITTDPYSFLIGLVANIDAQISAQMDAIIHNPVFQKLEASWRGLQKLVFNTETGTHLKLRLLPITKKELYNDLMRAVEFDQSALFKKVYEDEYGTLGGTPYSCLVGDFAFGRSKYDIELLRAISTLAAASHAPFIGGVNPNMFDIESFADLGVPRDLASIFESSELAAWNSFRQTEDSRYVSLVLPTVLMRSPYDPEENPCESFNYEEDVEGTNNSLFCWGNPAYDLALKITTAYAEFSWTTAIRGEEGGGKVESLPTFTYETDGGDVELKCPCQVSITDRREKELSNLGFISLCHSKGNDHAVFFSGQTSQKAKRYNTPDASANAVISTRLPYLLNASRFAHYIKMLMRAKIGSFLTAAEVQVYLQNWIAQYVLLSDMGTQEVKSRYPLRLAKITVVDSPDDPGSYKAIILLKPHFQLEELAVSLRLVAKL